MSGALRVLAVTNHYPSEESPGDTPCIRDQVLSLRRLGIEVDVIRIDRARRRRSYLRTAARLFRLSFQRKRYDLVHAYYGYAGLLARLQFKYPVVVTFRGSDLLSRRNRRIGPLVARSVEGVIVMSEEMRRVSRREDARVIPFGVDLERCSPGPIDRARRELGLSLEEELVLFPWNPERPEKRFDLASAAVRALQHERPGLRLLPIWNEPPERVFEYMKACDALLLVSDREGAPMAVREALACGLPIVSVDVGDVRRLIGDLEGCHVCRQDVDDVAQKLRLALARGRRLDVSRDRIPDAAQVAREVIEVYERVLGSNRRP